MPQRTFHVLVVDDAPIVRSVVAAVLGSRYAVHECANGREALVLLEHLQMDAIVTDLDMPLLDGVGLIRALHGRGASCPPVLVMCAPAQRSRLEDLLEPGRVEWLGKPFDPEELRVAVARMLPSQAPPAPKD
jgi:CheY-like chemotaxis protein